MKLDILQKKIAEFGRILGSREDYLHAYKYEMLKNFRDAWNLVTDDFAGMYDRALQSDVTRRWWKKDNYRPKEMMLLLINSNPEYARQSFKELFNESKNVENRVDRFIFYCDEMLRMYKKANPRSIENNHYQDSVIISLYLAGMYPDRYTLYPGRVIFHEALRVLQAKESIAKEDLPRFFKLCQTLSRYLLEDASVVRQLNQGRRQGQNLLLVHEFLYFLTGRWAEAVPV